MGKSSSSRKKERRSRRKSRNRKLKFKKQRRRHDSPSYSDSETSCSSSDDDCKVGRSQSGMRKDAKSRKRGAQKRSRDRKTRDSSPHPKKRKYSKRDYDSKTKRTYKKKKRRRDVSVSAASDDSLSCSTCREGSSSGSGSEFDRHRGRSRKRKTNLGNTEGNRYTSKSRSPDCEHQIEVEDDSFVGNSRRLKSIIVVAGEQYESKDFFGDEQQEEFMYHPDDNHTSFGDVDGSREIDYVSSKEVPKETSEKEVAVPDIRNCVGIKNYEGQINESNDNNGGQTDDYSLNETRNDCSGNSDGINGVDLESILRQRALANLRRFKGAPRKDVETPANPNVDKNNDPKQLDHLVSKSVHAKFAKDDAEANDVGFSRPDSGNVVNFEENGAKFTGIIDSAVTNMRNFDHSSHNLGNGSNELQQEVINDNNGQKAEATIYSTTNQSNLVIAASRPQSKHDSDIKQEPASQESVQRKQSISDMSVKETAKIVTETMNNDDQNTGNGYGSSASKPSSSLKAISGETNLTKSGHENAEASQFEQKTMSVMRGGEMVQVNYKVYIPKRASALAKRQLKR